VAEPSIPIRSEEHVALRDDVAGATVHCPVTGVNAGPGIA
jgi:hypothetical protein